MLSGKVAGDLSWFEQEEQLMPRLYIIGKLMPSLYPSHTRARICHVQDVTMIYVLPMNLIPV